MHCRLRQAPLSMGFLRQEYQSGLPFPSPGDLPDPGIESMSPALADRFFTTEPSGMPSEMLPSSFPFLTRENSLLLRSPGK